MLAALVVGGLTAWYLGMRAGVIAAIATAAALIVAAFVPGVNLAVYALVIAWSAALYFLGPKMGKSKDAPGANGAGLAGLTVMAGQARDWFKKKMGS